MKSLRTQNLVLAAVTALALVINVKAYAGRFNKCVDLATGAVTFGTYCQTGTKPVQFVKKEIKAEAAAGFNAEKQVKLEAALRIKAGDERAQDFDRRKLDRSINPKYEGY